MLYRKEAGFIITSVQSHPITVEYRDILQLMHHLQVWDLPTTDWKGMGENNAMLERRNLISRVTLKEANELYKVIVVQDINHVEIISFKEWRDYRNI